MAPSAHLREIISVVPRGIPKAACWVFEAPRHKLLREVAARFRDSLEGWLLIAWGLHPRPPRLDSRFGECLDCLRIVDPACGPSSEATCPGSGVWTTVRLPSSATWWLRRGHLCFRLHMSQGVGNEHRGHFGNRGQYGHRDRTQAGRESRLGVRRPRDPLEGLRAVR